MNNNNNKKKLTRTEKDNEMHVIVDIDCIFPNVFQQKILKKYKISKSISSL